jgi:hypothetical protein
MRKGDLELLGAPVSRRVGFWAISKAAMAGRRDRRSATIAESGNSPYTKRLDGQTAIREAAVGRALHAAVSKVDQDFVALCTAIAQHRLQTERTTVASNEGFDGSARPAVGTIEAAVHARLEAKLAAQLADDAKRIAELVEVLPTKLAARRHLVGAARALVEGHIARFTVLAAAYRRGVTTPFRRRSKATDHRAVDMSLPTYSPVLTWVRGDLPILVTSMDPATKEVISWASREFGL